MDTWIIVLIATVIGVAIGTAGGVGADVLIAWFRKQIKSAKKRKRKVARKARSDWLTRRQLEVLYAIRQHGRGGVLLWYTSISLSTIRSLAKRDMVDTRSRGRIVCTRLGRRRLSQPWPTVQPTGDQKDRGDVVASGAGEVAPVASEGTLSARPPGHVLDL